MTIFLPLGTFLWNVHKCQYFWGTCLECTRLNSVMSQKTAVFIIVTMKISAALNLPFSFPLPRLVTFYTDQMPQMSSFPPTTVVYFLFLLCCGCQYLAEALNAGYLISLFPLNFNSYSFSSLFLSMSCMWSTSQHYSCPCKVWDTGEYTPFSSCL
jgi:hypothetical protein